LKLGFWINPLGKGSYRHKPIDFSKINIFTEIPRTYQLIKLIMTISWISVDYCTENYSNMISVGGILMIRLYGFPSSPRVDEKWTMRFQITDEKDIKELFYPEGQGNVNY
jgi:hypothetical protein